jgi:hypothetical protein
VRAGGPAAQPGQLLAGQVAPAGLGRRRPAGSARPRRRPSRRSRRGSSPRAARDLPGPGADRVEEPPVVRDDHDPAAPGDQVLREPADALDVEVVRRARRAPTEVRVADQRGGSATRRFSPAGQSRRRRSRLRPIARAPEPVQDVADLGSAPTRARRSVATRRRGPARRAQRVALDEVGRAAPTRLTRPPAARGGRRDVEQRGLAAAVEPDDTDPLALLDAERDRRRAAPATRPRARGAVTAQVDEVLAAAASGVHRRARDRGGSSGSTQPAPARARARPRPSGTPRHRRAGPTSDRAVTVASRGNAHVGPEPDPIRRARRRRPRAAAGSGGSPGVILTAAAAGPCPAERQLPRVAARNRPRARVSTGRSSGREPPVVEIARRRSSSW